MIFTEYFLFVPQIPHFAENTRWVSIHSLLQTRPRLGSQIFSGMTHHLCYPEDSPRDFLLSPRSRVAATPRPEGPSWPHRLAPSSWCTAAAQRAQSSPEGDAGRPPAPQEQEAGFSCCKSQSQANLKQMELMEGRSGAFSIGRNWHKVRRSP